MASTTCGLEGPGQKVKINNKFKNKFSSMKTIWANSWPIISQLFCFYLWVMKLISA